MKITTPIRLSDFKTDEIDEKAGKKLKKLRRQISKLQNTMYAEGKYAALICLQGMDTSGKDSLIREVFKEVNVQGVEVHSFKIPTELELSQNFLWRHYICIPPKGKIAIFNRSHYENVLVTRVHPELTLLEKIPGVETVEAVNNEFFNTRFEEINNFEKQIASNGTIVLKFFLHLSKEEQKNRLLRRLRLKEKNWKFSPGDLKERKLWDEYQWCYEDLLNKTSTNWAPWYIIPADDKGTARVKVAEVIYDVFKSFNFKEPELPANLKAELANYRKQLEND